MTLRNLIERRIPFEKVKEIIQLGLVKYEDKDVAALIWHSDLTMKEKNEKLLDIRNRTEDENLRSQIEERISYDERSLEAFEHSSEKFIYVAYNDEYDGESTFLGFFRTYQLARKAGINAGYDFKIKKYMVICEENDKVTHRLIKAGWFAKDGEDTLQEYYDWPEGPIAELELRADGEILNLRSEEIPVDELVRAVETLDNRRFETKFVEMPNPFDAGDIVRDVMSDRVMVVVTSREEWKKCVTESKRQQTILDWSDAVIMTAEIEENKDEPESRTVCEHINPIWLEKA